MTYTLIRTKQIFYAQGDRTQAGVRCYYEDGSRREFVAGVTADHDEAHRLAAALEARLCAAPITD